MVANKIIEKDTPQKLSTQKASVPRSLSVKWDSKAKSNVFARDKVVNFNDKIFINREDIKNLTLHIPITGPKYVKQN